MSKFLLGFLGAGNMGGALATAACKGVGGDKVVLSDKDAARAEALAAQLGCHSADKAAVIAEAKFLFIGLKPQVIGAALPELAPGIAARKDRFVLVSMVAGTAIEKLEKLLGGAYPIIRIMPNTPASVGAGMILYDYNSAVTAAEAEEFTTLMAQAGRFDHLPEHLIDAGSCVSGCGPAFVDLFIEALADGGVACGLPRDKAQLYAEQMVYGTAKLALESGKHPGVLKDMVCSPGGTTIQGVRALEAGGLRSSVFEAVIAAYEKTLAL